MLRSIIEFIDLKTQYARLQENINKGIQGVLDHGQYIMGPEVFELEGRLADFVGVKHCIAASSGTDTLILGLMALGIQPGDEVITTPFSFMATAEAIALLGAIPVFVDIDPLTYNINPLGIQDVITPRTKAIMPVSLFGQCADFNLINKIAEKNNLAVIEDGAQSFGAKYKGRRSCGLTTIGSTSFFPSKPLGCYGDGGALFTDDDALAKTMRELRVHGQDRRYHHPRIGLNARMDTLQAAVLLAKLEIFESEIQARLQIGSNYTELLKGVVKTPYIEPFNSTVYAQYTIEVSGRDALISNLNLIGIPTAIHYPVPLHMQPAFSSLQEGSNGYPMAELAAKSVMSIPMHPYLEDREVGVVVDAIKAASKVIELKSMGADNAA